MNEFFKGYLEKTAVFLRSRSIQAASKWWALLLILGCLLQSQLVLPQSAFAQSTLDSLLVGNTSGSLEELISPGASLSSLDGTVVFDGFSFNLVSVTASAPTPTEIFVEVLGSTELGEISLQFSINGASQILQFGEAYELEIQYQTRSQLEGQRFSEVSLDLEGATLGTAGTGRVQIEADIAPLELAALSALPLGDPFEAAQTLGVFDEGDGSIMPTDFLSLPSEQESLLVTAGVVVSGGEDASSGAVLTDFQISFTVVPEPQSLLMLLSVVGFWIAFPSLGQRRLCAD